MKSSRLSVISFISSKRRGTILSSFCRNFFKVTKKFHFVSSIIFNSVFLWFFALSYIRDCHGDWTLSFSHCFLILKRRISLWKQINFISYLPCKIKNIRGIFQFLPIYDIAWMLVLKRKCMNFLGIFFDESH